MLKWQRNLVLSFTLLLAISLLPDFCLGSSNVSSSSDTAPVNAFQKNTTLSGNATDFVFDLESSEWEVSVCLILVIFPDPTFRTSLELPHLIKSSIPLEAMQLVYLEQT